MKKLFKKIVFCALLTVSFCVGANAQITVFQAAEGITEESLDDVQREKYDAIQAKGLFSALTLITFDAESLFDPEGLLKFEVDNQLDDLAFKSFRVDHTSPDDFVWFGEYFNFDSLADNQASRLTIVANGGHIIAKVQTDVGSFITYDLGGGIHVLAEYDQNIHEGLEGGCALGDDHPPVIMSDDNNPCSIDRLKVMVVYTLGGAFGTYPHDLNTFAQTCVSLMGGAYIVSGVSVQHLPTLVHTELVPGLPESLNFLIAADPRSSIRADLHGMIANTYLQDLRQEYEADIVVIIANPIYKNNNSEYLGWAGSINTPFDSAYAIVTADHAISHLNNFSHEANHLLGGRHENDPDPGTAHAHTFNTGFLGLKTRRTTMFSGLKETIQNLSNPDKEFSGKATGTATANNAAAVNAYAPTVKAFFSDGELFEPQIEISGHGKCSQTGTATAVVPSSCQGPFTYEWSYSDNGLAWGIIPGSNTPSISTYVPYPLFATTLGMYNTRQYSVKVTSSYGVSGATATAVYSCPSLSNFEMLSTKLSAEVDGTLQVNPNPVSNSFELLFNMNDTEKAIIQLFDASGKLVRTLYRGDLEKGHNKMRFERDFAPGSYFVRVIGAGTLLTGKLIAE